MFSKKLKLSFVATLLAISPVAIVASCAQTTDNQESQTLLKVTVFNAKDLGLNLEIGKAIKEINETWLIQHKDQIFNGTTSNLNNANQIKYLQASANLNQLTISFKLAAGAYTDAAGEVASQDSMEFSFRIKGFNSNQSGQIIDLETVAKTASFKVANLNQLASKVQPSEIIWDQAGANQKVSLVINSLIPDDQTGHLGFNFSIYQTDLTSNNLTVNVLPDSPQAIAGFQKVAVQPSDQKLVDEEVERLKKLNIINVTKLTNLEISQFEIQPQQFITNLINLNNKFNYQVLTFSSKNLSNNNKVAITIDLQVSYQTAKAKLQATKEIEILNININNPDLVLATEKKRLNSLISKSFLLKTNFNENEIDELKVNPNKILKLIFNFISQQYFHYKVSNLEIEQTTKNTNIINANLKFNIQAKYWKTIGQIKPTISSEQFSYPITITYQTDRPVPEPTTKGWKIDPVDQAKPTIENGIPLEDSYELEINLNQDQNLDLALIDWKTDQAQQLMDKIFNEHRNQFVKQTGDLPNNWNWNDYAAIYNPEPILDPTNQKVIGISAQSQWEYVDSSDLDKWFTINISFVNGYNSGKPLPTIDAQTKWNQIKTEFETLVNNQEFDQNKLHQGLNGVYSFAQINVDSPVKGDFFTNFLNFSVSDFELKWRSLIETKISEASINYLTNTIKFKWHLQGRNELANFKWDSNLLTLQYQPNGVWQDGISFSNQGDLAINNATSINNILDRFTFSNEFVPKNILSEKFQRFGANWTWKARELANYVRFTFYQAFNNGASAINMAIENLPQVDLNQNPGGYTIVLKAKLNQAAEGNYLPYLQMFGLGLGVQPKTWQTGDLIEIRLDVNEPSERPDVVTDGNEIFPGMNPGAVLGTGKGAVEAYLNTPPRTDLYSISLGKTRLIIKHNQQTYASSNANHRFLALNMLSRYDFQDPIWQEPELEQGWTK